MRLRSFQAACAGLLLGLSGCGGDGELSTDERGDVAVHGAGQIAVQQALLAVDQTMEIDPTLDVTKTAAENAQAILARAQAGGACVTASVAGATVTVDFGTGCDVRGTALAGSMSLTVTKTGGTLTVIVNFTSLVVDGADLAGSVSLMTAGNGSYQVTFDLTSGDASGSGTLTVDGAPTTLTMSGALSASQGGQSISASLASVVYVLGDCYPSAGTVTLSGGRLAGTITFLATTPQDGRVQVSTRRLTTTAALPAYGPCPP
jgi:hypothetical protein